MQHGTLLFSSAMDSEEQASTSAAAAAAAASTPMEVDDPPATSELYNSVIMRPVPFPLCFAALTNIYHTIEINGLDVNTVSNAIGNFLNSEQVNFLYIAGYRGTHADFFFEDLRNTLEEEPEIGFHTSLIMLATTPFQKNVVRVYDLDPLVPTHRDNHKIIEFRRTVPQYEPFNDEEFASFIYCGNTENGPTPRYECHNPRGLLCVRRSLSNRRACGICFWIPMKGKMQEPELLGMISDSDTEDQDEAAVSYPLGTHPRVYTNYLTSTDYDFKSSDTYDSNCEL